MRFATLGVVLAICALAPCPAAAGSKRGHAHVTEGSCQLHGVARFGGSGMGNVPAYNTYGFVGRGTCDGTLDGRPISGTPVVVRVRGAAMLSCVASYGLADDPGTMRFTRGTKRRSDDVVIRFLISPLVGLVADNVFRVRGAVSGEAVGHSSFLAYSKPDTPAQCAAGTLKEGEFDSTVKTVTPIVG